MAVVRAIRFTSSSVTRARLALASLAKAANTGASGKSGASEGPVQPEGPIVFVVEQSALTVFESLAAEVEDRGTQDKGRELSRYLLDREAVPLVLSAYTEPGRLQQGVKAFLKRARAAGESKPYVVAAGDKVFERAWSQAEDDAQGPAGSDSGADPSVRLLALLRNVKVPAELREAYAGESAAAEVVRRLIVQASQCDVPVLIAGETGTGKEVVARKIHDLRFDPLHHPEDHHQYVAINCSGIPSELVETELFGYEKGAFTGASERKIGLWRLADRGTLFLDEVGDLPLDSQAKVLRAIEQREILPVGGTTPIKVNTRIIAATNRDLQAMTGAQLFREDLLQRLCGMVIHTPPLSRHPEEIASFARMFWKEISKGRSELPEEILRALEVRQWPGNVRELKQTLLHLAALFGTESLRVEHIRAVFEIRDQVMGPAGSMEHCAAAGTYRAECLRVLNRALELTQACEAALAAVSGSRGVSRTAWPALRRTLDGIRNELAELSTHPIWFHSINTFRAAQALGDSLAKICGDSGESARRKLAARRAGLKAAIDSAAEALFREAGWLGAAPDEGWGNGVTGTTQDSPGPRKRASRAPYRRGPRT